MTRLTFDQAQAIHTHIARDDTDTGGSVIYPFLRSWARDQMVERHPHDECGSSDVSIFLTERLRSYEVPLVGPVVAAYKACGHIVPASILYPDAF